MLTATSVNVTAPAAGTARLMRGMSHAPMAWWNQAATPWATMMSSSQPTGLVMTSVERYDLINSLASRASVSSTNSSMVGVMVDLNFQKQYVSITVTV